MATLRQMVWEDVPKMFPTKNFTPIGYKFSTLTSLRFDYTPTARVQVLDSCSLARTFISPLPTFIFHLST